jgi:hypothetical protein
MTKDSEGFNISAGKRIADEANICRALKLWDFIHDSDEFFSLTIADEPPLAVRYSDDVLPGLAEIMRDEFGFKPSPVLLRAAIFRCRAEQSPIRSRQ